MKPLISFTDFSKLDIRVGTVIECVEKEGSDKLLKLTVDFGEEGQKTIFSGIKKWYTPEDLKDKQFIFIINLEPRKMMDEYSEGMLMAADSDSTGADGENGAPQPLKPQSPTPNGAKIL